MWKTVVVLMAVFSAFAIADCNSSTWAEQVTIDAGNAASVSAGFGRLAQYAVDGTGLTGDAHSTSCSDMWLENPPAVDASMTIFLGDCYWVDGIKVWNYNEGVNINCGIQTALIETSVDGVEWYSIADPNQTITQAPGLDTYDTPDEICIEETCRYIRITCIENYGGTYAGLAEVQVFGSLSEDCPEIGDLIEDVTATASSELSGFGRVATDAADSSGWDPILMSHDADPSNMWEASDVYADILFDLQENYNINSIYIWNYNESGCSGRGIESAVIMGSSDGSDWDVISYNFELSQAPGTAGYNSADVISDPNGGAIGSYRYISIASLGTFANDGYCGLSEVKFYGAVDTETVDTTISGGITATSDNPLWEDSIGARVAQLAVDGSGMTGTVCGSNPNYMWLEGDDPLTSWTPDGANMTVDLGGVCTLTDMTIYNYNESGYDSSEPRKMTTRGIKQLMIETSLDNETWAVSDANIILPQAPWPSDYTEPNATDIEDVECRYVRFTSVENYGDPYYVGLSEIVFRGERYVDPYDLITGVTASSPNPGFGRLADYVVDDSGMTDDVCSNVVDATMWLENAGDDPVITFDLNGCYTVNALQVWNYNEAANLDAGLEKISIEYTPDGYNWFEVSEETLTMAPGTADYDTPDTFFYIPFDAKYIRFTGLSSYGSAWGSGLSEVRFYGAPLEDGCVEDVDPTLWDDEQLIDPNDASSPSSEFDRLAEYTIDGSGMTGDVCSNVVDPTMWLENNSDDMTLTVNLGQAYILEGVKIWNYNESGNTSHSAKTIEISYALNDDEDDPNYYDYTEIQLNEAPGTADYDTPNAYTLEGLKAQFLKFRITENFGGAYGAGLSEVRFYGYSAVDLNMDGSVNLFDFAKLAEEWSCSEDCGNADIDDDGVVDLEDLAEMVIYWTE